MSSRADNTKQKLYDAAVAVLGEKGFTGTSVDEIVERAGVAKGTVYYHFAGKAELMEALIEDRMRPLADAFRQAADDNSGNPSAALAAIIRAELLFFSDDTSFSKLLLTEMWREDRVWRSTLLMLRDEMFAVIERVIVQGIESGAFRGGIDPAFGASALFGMTATTALDWLAFRPETPLEAVAAQINAIVAASTRPDAVDTKQ